MNGIMGFGVNLPYCLEQFGNAVAVLEHSRGGWRDRLHEAVGHIIPTSNVLPQELQRAFHSIIDQAYRLHAGESKGNLRAAMAGMTEPEGQRLMADIKAIHTQLQSAQTH